MGSSRPNAPCLAPIHSLEVSSIDCPWIEPFLPSFGKDSLKSRACQLSTAMHTVSLKGKSIDEYLRKIKGYVDELAGVGVPIRHEEYVDALLEGLSFD